MPSALTLVGEARRRGVHVVWGPPARFRGTGAGLALLKEMPDTARELLSRAVIFRDQAERWATSGRLGVPLLALPDAPPTRLGACISCGAPIAGSSTWRCGLCREAVELALGLRSGSLP